jgi:anti-anti-sigma factor
MTIVERPVGDVTVLELAGRFVLFEGESEFRSKMDELVAKDRLKIVVDLQGVSYIDSAGVGVLVGKYLSVRRKGGDVKLLHLSTRSLRVMSITRLTGVFESYDREEDALRSFSPTQPA